MAVVLALPGAPPIAAPPALPGMMIAFLGRLIDVRPIAFELETIGGLNILVAD